MKNQGKIRGHGALHPPVVLSTPLTVLILLKADSPSDFEY